MLPATGIVRVCFSGRCPLLPFAMPHGILPPSGVPLFGRSALLLVSEPPCDSMLSAHSLSRVLGARFPRVELISFSFLLASHFGPRPAPFLFTGPSRSRIVESRVLSHSPSLTLPPSLPPLGTALHLRSPLGAMERTPFSEDLPPRLAFPRPSLASRPYGLGQGVIGACLTFHAERPSLAWIFRAL